MFCAFILFGKIRFVDKIWVIGCCIRCPSYVTRVFHFPFFIFHFPSCMTPKFNIKVFNFHFYSKVSELQKMSYEVIICLTQFYNVIIHNFTRFSKSAIPDFLKMSTVSTLCWFKNVRGWNIPILLNIAFISNEHIINT